MSTELLKTCREFK